VIELGCGDGSTPYLREYCNENGIEFLSYDNNQEWADKHNSIYVSNWENIPWLKEYSVAFVDEAPGEHRKVSLSLLHHVKVVICHDSEPAAEHGYQMRPQILKYKYWSDFKTDGAWASAMSNFIDVTRWQNL